MILELNPAKWFGGKPAAAVAAAGNAVFSPVDFAAQAEPSNSAKAVESVMTSFFSKLKAAISSMWKKAPAIEVALASAVNSLVPVVEQLDTIILGPESLILNPILDKLKVGLSALKATIQDAGAKPNLASITAAVQSHLSELVSAAQVKDPALATKIKEVTDIVAAEVSNIHAAAGA